MLKQILLSCLMASLATAEEAIPFDGKCPDLKPAADFDVEKYGSISPWYNAYFYGNMKDFFQQVQCMEIRLKYDAEQKVLNINAYYVNQSKSVWMDSPEDLIPDQPGTFQYPESVRKASSEWYFQVVHKLVMVDYDHYVVLWGCYDIEGEDKHYEFALINSRQRPLSDEHYNEINAYFAEHHPIVKFEAAKWDDCRVKCDA